MSVEANQRRNLDPLENWEKALAFGITGGSTSSIRHLTDIYVFFPASSDIEKLSHLRKFIGEHAFERRQPVNLKDGRIQHLFDLAIENAIQKDCAKALAAYQDHLQTKISRELYKSLRDQEEARKSSNQSFLSKAQATVATLWKRVKAPAVETAPRVHQLETEDDLIVLESAEEREAKTTALLKQWEEDPSSIPIPPDVKKGIEHLRNELLPKAKVLLADLLDEEKTAELAPSCQLVRRS